MTLGSLMNWGGFAKAPPVSQPIERYHIDSRGGYWEHKSHGHGKGGGGSKGGGSGAALSALTLLAFLFLINVMQQSLQDNNSTMTTGGMGTAAVLLRDGEQPVALNGREETGQKAKSLHELGTTISSGGAAKSKSKKGDTIDGASNGQIYVIPFP